VKDGRRADLAGSEADPRSQVRKGNAKAKQAVCQLFRAYADLGPLDGLYSVPNPVLEMQILLQYQPGGAIVPMHYCMHAMQ